MLLIAQQTRAPRIDGLLAGSSLKDTFYDIGQELDASGHRVCDRKRIHRVGGDRSQPHN